VVASAVDVETAVDLVVDPAVVPARTRRRSGASDMMEGWWTRDQGAETLFAVLGSPSPSLAVS
jgi:hypothetical protein